MVIVSNFRGVLGLFGVELDTILLTHTSLPPVDEVLAVRESIECEKRPRFEPAERDQSADALAD